MASVPLICFDMVEWHWPDRVMRQFGHQQHIPGSCDNLPQLYKVDRKGKHDKDWASTHVKYIRLWDRRAESIFAPRLHDSDISRVAQEYMSWYKRITRQFLSPQIRPPVGHYQPVAPDLYLMVSV